MRRNRTAWDEVPGLHDYVSMTFVAGFAGEAEILYATLKVGGDGIWQQNTHPGLDIILEFQNAWFEFPQDSVDLKLLNDSETNLALHYHQVYSDEIPEKPHIIFRA